MKMLNSPGETIASVTTFRRGTSQKYTGSKGTQIADLFAIPKFEFLKCRNELQPADARIGHVGRREVEFLQSATILQAAHVGYLHATP
jgi:hypothetical protein